MSRSTLLLLPALAIACGTPPTAGTDQTARDLAGAAQSTADEALADAATANEEASEADDEATGAQTTADANAEDIEALEQRIDDLEALVVALTTDGEGRDTRLGDAEAQLDALGGRVDTAEAITSAVLVEDTTWSVGPTGDYADLPAAFEALDGVLIAGRAILTLQLEAGTHTHTDALEITHKDARNVHIVGDVASPASVVLQFDGADGLVVKSGASLGLLAGVTVRGDGSTASANGVLVTDGGFLGLTDDNGDGALVIEDFDGACLWADDGAVVRDGTDNAVLETYRCEAGVQATRGSVLDVAYAADDGSHQSFVATGNSTINAVNATAAPGTGAQPSGFHATHGGAIDATSSLVAGQGIASTYAGYVAAFDGNINARYGVASGMTYGALASEHAYIDARNSDISSCGRGLTGLANSAVQADSASVDDCSVGVRVSSDSYAYAAGAAISNSTTAYQIDLGGLVHAFATTLTNNGATLSGSEVTSSSQYYDAVLNIWD